MVDVQLARDLANEIRLREKAEAERDRAVELLREVAEFNRAGADIGEATEERIEAFLASLDAAPSEEG